MGLILFDTHEKREERGDKFAKSTWPKYRGINTKTSPNSKKFQIADDDEVVVITISHEI